MFSWLELISLQEERTLAHNLYVPHLPPWCVFLFHLQAWQVYCRQICYSMIEMSSSQKSSIKFQSLELSFSAFYSSLLVNTFLIIGCSELYHLITLQVQFPGAVYCDSRALEAFLPFTEFLFPITFLQALSSFLFETCYFLPEI